MSEDEYRKFVAMERVAALNHLLTLLHEWRRELWPDPHTDPIAREDRMSRLRAELAIAGYWGAAISTRRIYGGICA